MSIKIPNLSLMRKMNVFLASRKETFSSVEQNSQKVITHFDVACEVRP